MDVEKSKISPQTLTIHYQFIDVARELINSAKELEDKGDIASLSAARARCAIAISVACAALEACANAIAGMHYEGPRGSHDAEEAGWPAKGNRQWHRKSAVRKWQDMAKLVPNNYFSMIFTKLADEFTHMQSLRQLNGWDNEINNLFKIRDELSIHFKGSWGPPGTEDAYNSLNIVEAIWWVMFARHMINGLVDGFEKKYDAKIEYHHKPFEEAAIPRVNKYIPEISPVGTGGTAHIVTDLNSGE